MRVNSINTYNYYNLKPAFKHTAVPYPEYQHHVVNKPFHAKISDVFNKLFNPEVTKKADEIKSEINVLYNNQPNLSNAKDKKVLTVFA